MDQLTLAHDDYRRAVAALQCRMTAELSHLDPATLASVLRIAKSVGPNVNELVAVAREIIASPAARVAA